jgi:hypothetical protein
VLSLASPAVAQEWADERFLDTYRRVASQRAMALVKDNRLVTHDPFVDASGAESIPPEGAYS